MLVGHELSTKLSNLEIDINNNIIEDVRQFKNAIELYEKTAKENNRRLIMELMVRKSLELCSYSVENSNNPVSLNRNNTEESLVDEPVNSEYVFHKFSPLKPDARLSIKCPFCQKTISSTRGFANHVRYFHVDQVNSEIAANTLSLFKNVEEGTCRLPKKDGSGVECGLKFSTDQFKRHFQVSCISLYILLHLFNFRCIM